jgi:PIN domain nuclease of toxin-antitoxin system
MTAAVLDASALLAMLLKEPGAERVEAILSDSAISTVNFGEIVGHYSRNGAAIDAVHRLLDPLPVERIDFDEALAFEVGGLTSISGSLGLSFGERACLALAMRLGVPALTTNKIWARLPNIDGLKVEIIR